MAKRLMLALVLSILLTLIPTMGAYAQNMYYLPHVTNGNIGGLICKTTFVLFNNSNTSVVAVLNLTDSSGNPLQVTLGNLGLDSQFFISLDAGATTFLQTDGAGAGAVGAASVNASTPIGVSAIFTVYDAGGIYMSEAGVGNSPLSADFVLPVDVGGPFNTGLAMFNPGGSSASITAILVGTDGTEFARTTVPLDAGRQFAVFVSGVDQLFPSVNSFRGTLLMQSNVPISAMVLRQYHNPSKTSFTSLPVVPRSSGKASFNFPQVATGAYGGIGNRTSFLIFNISAAPADVNLALTQDNGSPLTVTIPGGGPGTGTGSNFRFSLAAGASIFLQTDGSGPLTSGAAVITSNVPIGASVVFTIFDSQGQFQTEAGVGDEPVSASTTIPADVTGNSDTGVAFFNPGTGATMLNFTLMDTNGVIVSTTTAPIAPGGHLAMFISQMFPGIAGFRGSLAFSCPGGVAALTLRMYGRAQTYTTLPSAPGVSSGQPAVSIFLPKVVTGVTAIAGDPDVALSDVLRSGSIIHGTISGGRALRVVASAGGSNVFASAVNPLTGNYLVAVPDGTYSLSVYYQPAGAPNSVPVTATYTDPDPVVVVLDAVRDIVLPAPPLTQVSGSLSGLISLLSAASPTVLFTSGDNKVQSEFALDQTGAYQGLLPPGTYTASLGAGPVNLLPNQSEMLQMYNLGSLNVGNNPITGNFAVPGLTTLSGTIYSGGVVQTATGIIVSTTDTSAPGFTASACCAQPASSTASADATGQYQMLLGLNRAYQASVSVPVMDGATLAGMIRYPINPSIVNLTGQAVLDFNMPAVRRGVILYGNISDGMGHALSGVTITAYSESLSDAPNVGFAAFTTTDIYGNYSIAVASGTNYRVSFLPPAPKY